MNIDMDAAHPSNDGYLQKLRAGLIADSIFSSRYVLELAQSGQTHEAVVVTHLLIIQRDPHVHLSTFQKAVRILKAKAC